jgi:2-oxoglutarate ferredoxin oxidoreductase subunit alpha
MAYEAVKIAIEHMTPVILLSDGYIANGSEPWRFPSSADLVSIANTRITEASEPADFKPYLRDDKGARPWALPGTKGLEHRIGGLEKEDVTGNISYDPENHQKMVLLRAKKVATIADHIPLQTVDNGREGAKLAIVTWGSTYGAVKTAVSEMLNLGYDVAHIHLKYLMPFPSNLGALIRNFEHVLVPELNNGQLVKILRSEFLVDAKPHPKIKGFPFSAQEIREAAINQFFS